MSAKITSIGNAGFLIASGSINICIDAFYDTIPGIAAPIKNATKADVVLVTHSHWDHFSAKQVSDVSRRDNAVIVGPRPVINELRDVAPRVLELEPPETANGRPAASLTAELSGVKITAFRTFHSRHHNSYLIETPGFRLFHDGDNEDTRRVDADKLGRLDALLIGPWQGSGWVEFIEKLNPSRYFLIHLTEEELNEHDSGDFLPGICDRVPPGLTVLRPGHSFEFK